MKKLFFGLALTFGFAGLASAQAAKATTAAKTPAPVVKMATPAKAAATTPAVKPAPVAKAAPATKTGLKADGTPDMRLKANKAAAAPAAGPKKADGTADMRYKANKTATKKP